MCSLDLGLWRRCHGRGCPPRILYDRHILEGDMDPNKDRRVIKGLRQGARKKTNANIRIDRTLHFGPANAHHGARTNLFLSSRPCTGPTGEHGSVCVASDLQPQTSYCRSKQGRCRVSYPFPARGHLPPLWHARTRGHGRGHVAQAARFLSLHLPQAGRLLSQRRPLARTSSVLAVFRVTCR